MLKRDLGSPGMACSLSVAELDRPIWEGELGLQADSGPTIPIVLHFTRLFSSRSHEDEGRVMGACGTESAKGKASPLQRLIY